ncbi:hypothetical protein ACQ4M3_36410 [Leptolyngbya sp. AN03gr2]|uniref:hypothetical protein n=1 Tax=unclassified Leptolyngbya TaxID=2650499 RepID=UPI003D31FFAE
MSLKSPIVVGASILSLASLSGIGYAIWRFSQPSSVSTSTEIAPASSTTSADVFRERLSCTITMAEVDTSNPSLSVYFAANDPSRIVGQLDNHSFVTVGMEQNGWFLIQKPLTGWIPKQQTQSSCNEKVEMVRFDAKGGTAAIADRFVGSGSHLYRLPLTEGATLTLSNTRGILPFVLAPEGELLLNPQESQINWTGRVPRTGVYTLEMLSQHKGYHYAFTISVK